MGGEDLNFDPDHGFEHKGDLMPDGPAWYTTSHTWPAKGYDAFPVDMRISQQYGSNLQIYFTFRVSQTHGCAVHTGVIRGGHNESEPYSCNCSKGTSSPVSTDTGNFYHSFADFSFGGRGPGLGLARTYNSSLAAVDGPFGYGWRSSAQVSLAENPTTLVVTVTQEGGSDSVFTPSGGSNYTASSYTDAVLTKQAGVGWTLVRGANTTMQFDTAGRLTSVTDPNGEYVNYAYASGQLATMTDRAGRTLTFAWTGTHVTSVVDSSSPARTVTYHYNAAGEMDYFTDVAGSTTSFTYDGSHRMLTMRDPRNQGAPTPHDVVNTYDAQGRVATQTDRNGGITSFDYTTWAGTTIVTDPKGNKIRYGYGDGLLQFVTKGYDTTKAATTQYIYDPATLGATKIIDPNGNATTFTYDSSFNRTGSTDPLNRQTSANYNSRHEPIDETVAGVTTTYTYDSRGNLQTTSTPLAGAPAVTQACPGYPTPPAGVQLTQLCYTDASHPGDVTSMIDPRGKTTTFHYDTRGNRDQTTDADGFITATTYSTAGFPLTITLPRGNVAGCGCASDHQWVFTTNARGQVLTARDPLGSSESGHVETRHYDANGNLDSVQDHNLQTTTYVYDNEDQLTETHRPDGVIEKTAYWPDGSLWKQIDGANQATVYTYDELARLLTVTDPDTRVTTFSYDLAGNQTGSVDNASRTVTNTFDVANELTAVNYSDPATPDITNIHYDAAGRKDAVTQSDGLNSSWTYDTLGRLTASNDSTGAVAYGYDPADNLTTITYPGTHLVTRGYDDAGRMTSSQDWLGNTTNFGYNEDGTMTSTDQPGNQRDNYGVDNADRITSTDFYSNYGTSTKFASLTYTRDHNNNLTGFTQTGLPGAASAAYGYNQTNMLTTLNSSSTWTYSSADNLTRTSEGRTQSFTAGNALCSTAVLTSSTCAAPTPDATKYTVDAVGSRQTMTPQTGNVITYGWDQLRQLRSLTPGAFQSNAPASWAHTLTVRADGTVQSFGLNDNGQLGDNTTTERHAPVAVLNTLLQPLGDIRVAATGAYHSAAIDNSGHLWMWGQNTYNQLTSQAGITNPQKTAVQLTDANLSNVAAVALGNVHTLALTANGAVYAWGNNANGQLGVGDTNPRSTPTQVSGLSSGVIAIATRNNSSYALKSDGTLVSWGRNDAGQLGSGDTVEYHSPHAVASVAGATAVSAGEFSAYALTSSGVKSWGLNTLNQLGRTCSGSACWTPALVGGLTGLTITAIAAGGYHGVALASTGSVYVWGSNSDGQLGQGTIGGTNPSSAIPITTIANIGSVNAGRYLTVAIGTDGTTYTFGDNANGQLGDGTTTDTGTATNQPAEARGDESSLNNSAPGGWYHTLALRTNGTVAASGLNSSGQLGDGTTTDRNKPVAVNGLKNITAVATGLYHSVALDTAGNVWTWGQNTNGQLGDGTTTDRHLPIRVYTASNAPAPNNFPATAIAANGNTTYALLSDGTVRAWGQNDKGQVGNHDYNPANVLLPTPVVKSDSTTLTGVASIAAGGATGYARTTAGAVWAWGAGGYGQLGDGTFANRPYAASITGLTATQISAGIYHAYALISGGGIKAWGYNQSGQLGNNTSGPGTNSATPVSVLNANLTTLTGATDVAAGGYHGLAVVAGAVKSWGQNGFGQLGINNTTDKSTAQAALVLTSGVANVDAGSFTSEADTTAHDLYAWGYNGYGGLGDGTTSNQLQPKLIKGALDLDTIPLATTYTYAGSGLRSAKTTGGVPTSYVWDHTVGAAALLTETVGNATTSYLYGPDGVAYETISPSGIVAWLHHDQLGSIRAITDTNATVLATASYDPYGNPTASGGTTTAPSIGWAGQYRDTETGLTYLRARYYDPDTAQFLSRDPWVAMTNSPYAYVNGNPVDRADPSGMIGIPKWVPIVGGLCIDIADPHCQSIKEQHPAGAQDAADFAAGLLDTLTFGHGQEIAGAVGVADRARWTSGYATAGNISGAVFQTVLGSGNAAVALANNVLGTASAVEACAKSFGNECAVAAAFSAEGWFMPWYFEKDFGAFGRVGSDLFVNLEGALQRWFLC
ncbi:MAG TPA: RHS repeat-associated core domain-containing protein [Acidimicrobiales bacterium]|nr:RHS repeat-associated core domain-containing protein [Acidimicrobiales bacterium]